MNVKRYQAMALELEMRYEMTETQTMGMAVPLHQTQLKMASYVVVAHQPLQTNVNSELLATIQMRIKINESIYEVMD